MKQICVFISNKGTGSNLQALIDATNSGEINAKITAVVSDVGDALGLQRAKKYKIPCLVFPLKCRTDARIRKIWGTKLAKLVKKYKPDLIVLAGWMLILPKSFLEVFPNKVINLHPGLIPDKGKKFVKIDGGIKIPSFAGKMAANAIAEAFRLGVPASGSTVHMVSPIVDEGKVLKRTIEYIRKNDTVDSFYERLKLKEHKILIEVVKRFCKK